MTPMDLNIFFAALALAGVVSVVFGIRHRRREQKAGAVAGSVHLEFIEEGAGEKAALGLDMEDEILRQPEKKPFEPEKHRPDILESSIERDEKPESK